MSNNLERILRNMEKETDEKLRKFEKELADKQYTSSSEKLARHQATTDIYSDSFQSATNFRNDQSKSAAELMKLDAQRDDKNFLNEMTELIKTTISRILNCGAELQAVSTQLITQVKSYNRAKKDEIKEEYVEVGQTVEEAINEQKRNTDVRLVELRFRCTDLQDKLVVFEKFLIRYTNIDRENTSKQLQEFKESISNLVTNLASLSGQTSVNSPQLSDDSFEIVQKGLRNLREMSDRVNFFGDERVLKADNVEVKKGNLT